MARASTKRILQRLPNNLIEMTGQQRTHISKFLSLVLRHKPDTIGLLLEEEGWANVEELLAKMAGAGMRISIEELEELVRTNSKQRFAYNEDHSKIRANQGHSIEVDLKLSQQAPPEYLYHGTVSKYIEQIKNEGLRKMSRHHVHLSKDVETATLVGSRRGKPVVLRIHSGTMQRDGHKFYCSGNGVWLTDSVPPKFIDF